MMRFILGFLIIGSVFVAEALVKPISDGGTNSATALNNGRLLYSFVQSIQEVDRIKTPDGKRLNLIEYGATDSALIAPAKLNLVGNDASNVGGPFMQAYTSADNHALFQILPRVHNDTSLNFDMYWNGTSVSSHAGSNYQIKKTVDKLQFNYGSGNAQGSSFTPATAVSIDNTGRTTFNQPIKLPTSGSSQTGLNYYAEYNASFPYTCGSESIMIGLTFTLVGNIVTMKTPGWFFTPNTTCYAWVNYTTLPVAFRPTMDFSWPIMYLQYSVDSSKVFWNCTDTVSYRAGFFVFRASALTGTHYSDNYYASAMSAVAHTTDIFNQELYYYCGTIIPAISVEYLVNRP